MSQPRKPGGIRLQSKKSKAKQRKWENEFFKSYGRYPQDPAAEKDDLAPLVLGNTWSNEIEINTISANAKSQAAKTPRIPNTEPLLNNGWSTRATSNTSNTPTSLQYIADRKIPGVCPLAASTPKTSSTWAAIASRGDKSRAPVAEKHLPTSFHAPPFDVSTPTPSPSGPPTPPFTTGGGKIELISLNTKDHWDTYKPFDPKPKKTPEEVEQEKAKEAVKLRVDQYMKGWPWRGNLNKGIMVGPLMGSGIPFANDPPVKQIGSKMLRVFKENGDIKSLVLDEILKSWGATSNFSLLCQETFDIISQRIVPWDISSGYFQGCEKACPENKEYGELDIKQPCYSKPPVHVVVASVRILFGQDHYRKQMVNLKTMTMAISNWADVIQTMQLHRVPFLTHQVLSLIVPQMRNLKALSVLKCQLIHVGHAEELLNIIKTDRPLGKENQISLDFYPNFHLGPVHSPGDEYSVGNYGITWDSFNGQPRASILGTWCLVDRFLSKAKTQGIDIESNGTMFKKWLEDGPCYEVDRTLRALGNPKFKEATEKLTGLLKIKKRDLTKDDIRDIKETKSLLATLVAYIDSANPDHRGNAQKFMGDIGNRFDGWEWMVSTYHCTNCASDLLGIFFQFPNLPNRGNDDQACIGCHLVDYLDNEKDHLKFQKRKIIKEWLHVSGEWNSNNLRKAIQDFDSLEIVNSAENLDNRRLKIMADPEDPWDPEYQARQRPLTHKYRNGMYTSRHRATQIWEKNWGLEARKNGEYDWSAVDANRQRAHGA